MGERMVEYINDLRLLNDHPHVTQVHTGAHGEAHGEAHCALFVSDRGERRGGESRQVEDMIVKYVMFNCRAGMGWRSVSVVIVSCRDEVEEHFCPGSAVPGYRGKGAVGWRMPRAASFQLPVHLGPSRVL